MVKPDRKDSLDVQIGQLIRSIRLARGWSQDALARQVGLSFQQVQKYENGSSRILASKLSEFADVLGVDVACFFHGMPQTIADREEDETPGVLGKDAWQLAARFDRIRNKETRKKILELVTSLAREQ